MLYANPGRTALIERNARSSMGLLVRLLMGAVLVWVLIFGATAAADSEESTSLEPAIIAKIEVKVLEGKDRDAEWIEIARDVISLYIAEGDPFSATKIGESLTALKTSGRFRTIDADSKAEKNGITLTYTVTPFELIKDIVIRGKYPLFENRVLNAMSMYPGNAFVQSVVDEQADLVAALYRKEGYIDPDVVIGAWKDPEDGNYILFVNIDKGPYYSLGRVVFKGNLSIDESTLKWRMRSWRRAIFGRAMGRFRHAVFQKDIDNIRRFYRRNQFGV